MFRSPAMLAVACRLGLIAFGLVLGAGTSSMVQAQAPAAQAPAAQAPPAQAPAAQAPAAQAAPPTKRVFASDAGMVLNFIKPDKTADFEAVMVKLKEALQKSDKPERKQQAQNWKVFKAAESGAGGAAIYVSVVYPAVKGADYTVTTILAEAFPTEVQDLYKKYADAFGTPSGNLLNLTLLSDLSK